MVQISVMMVIQWKLLKLLLKQEQHCQNLSLPWLQSQHHQFLCFRHISGHTLSHPHICPLYIHQTCPISMAIIILLCLLCLIIILVPSTQHTLQCYQCQQKLLSPAVPSPNVSIVVSNIDITFKLLSHQKAVKQGDHPIVWLALPAWETGSRILVVIYI